VKRFLVVVLAGAFLLDLVRENVKILGNLAHDLDFAQKPRLPLILPLHPPFS
jgi:hypothetical protein